MLPRRRRLVYGVAVVIGLLVLGRWTTAFVVERLWESTVSEAAALVGTRFALQRGALELLGIATAIAWFVTNFVWTARSLISGFDAPRPRQPINERAALWGAAAIGIVLGIAVGGGTGNWIHPLLVFFSGVTYGQADNLLGADLGAFLGDLPLWNLLYGRAVALVAPTLIALVVAGLLTGSITIQDRQLQVSARIRRQLSSLATIGAVVLSWRFALEPLRLASLAGAEIGPAEFLLRSLVADVLAAIAAGTAITTIVWGFRNRLTVALWGWGVLAAAAIVGAIVVRSRSDSTQPNIATSQLREVDSVAYGLAVDRGGATLPIDDLGPSLWDSLALAKVVAPNASDTVQIVPGTVPIGRRHARVWFVFRAGANNTSFMAVADHRVGPTGGILTVRWGDTLFLPGDVPYGTISRYAARPDAPLIVIDSLAPGIGLGSAPRRIAAAWALQYGAALRARPNEYLAWRLDPVTRLTAIAPFAYWTEPRAMVIDREVYWISEGILAHQHFPATRAINWQERDYGYFRSAFIGVVNARGGSARVYLRRGSDSLAAAWSRIAAPLIEPADSLQPMLAEVLGTSPITAAIQAQALSGVYWGPDVERLIDAGTEIAEIPYAGSRDDPHRFGFRGPDTNRVTALLLTPASRGSLLLVVDTGRATWSPKRLETLWDQSQFYGNLRDSAYAARATVMRGAVRYSLADDTILAYQPVYSISSRPRLLVVNIALGKRTNIGRTFEEAWAKLHGDPVQSRVGTDVNLRMIEASQWFFRADSALRRGDFEQFGRAWSYLKAFFQATEPEEKDRPNTP